MNIICFGQQNWDLTWTEKQQLMTRLARRGHRVLYVDPIWNYDAKSSADSLHALRNPFAGLRHVGPTETYVYRHTYVHPLRRFNRQHYQRTLRHLQEQLQLIAPVTVSFIPQAIESISALRNPSASVYYAVDEWTGFGSMSEAERSRVREQETALLRQSELAFAVSPRLLERFRTLQPHSFLLENGVDPDHFAPSRLATLYSHPAFQEIPHPRLGFVGQIDGRMDQELLVAVARARPAWQIVLIGRVTADVDVSSLRAENIHFVEFQPYDALPSVLREMDVCLVPYRSTEATESCNPAKIFEYVAADRPVVSVPLEGIQACRSAISLASTPEEFVRAIEEALANPTAGHDRRMAVAQENSWERRTDRLEQLLEQAVHRARTKRPIRRGQPVTRRVRRERVYRDGNLKLKGRLFFQTTSALGWIYYGLRVGARVAARKPSPKVRKILVGHKCTLGELVAYMPALRALRERYPHAHITFGTSPGTAVRALLEQSPYIDEVREIGYSVAPSPRERFGGALRLFAEGWDLTVSGERGFYKTEVLFSGAPFRIGLDDSEPLQALNSHIVRVDHTRHIADEYLGLVDEVSEQWSDVPQYPDLAIDEDAVRAGRDRLLDQLAIPPEAPLLAVAPGGSRPSRWWPREDYSELVSRLLAESPGLWVVLTGTPGESDLVDSILRAIPDSLRNRVVNSVGRTDLPTLVGILDRSSVLVCNDSGAMHLARARGVPLVALLGPENHRRWGPHEWGPGPAVALREIVPCAPCKRADCHAQYCLRSLSVEQVHEQVSQMLSNGNRPSGSAERALSVGAVGAPEHAGPPIRLERRVGSLTWNNLLNRGFALPLVSVIYFVEPFANGAATAAPGGSKTDQQEIARFLEDMSKQRYPMLQVVLAMPEGVRSPDVRVAGTAVALASFSRGADARSIWSSVLSVAEGEFLVPYVPGGRWTSEKIADHVAALVRWPGAITATSGMAPAGEHAWRDVLQEGLTVRRSKIEALLCEPHLEGSSAQQGRIPLGQQLASPDMRIELDVPFSEVYAS